MQTREVQRIASGRFPFAFVFLCLVTFAVFETPVQAYVDPGTTGMIVQVIIGVVAAVAYGVRRALKQAWLGVWTIVVGRKSK